MFSITPFTIIDGRNILSIPIFPTVMEDPNEHYLYNYEDSDIGSCASTLGVEAIISDGIFRMGDSNKTFAVVNLGMRGEAGMQQFKHYVTDFVHFAEEALPYMSEDYKKFYQYMIDDFYKNGIYMPHYGKL